MRFQLHVNRARREVNVPPGTSLLSVLRNDLGLTGSRFGCGQGVCGACYVLLDGVAVPSCNLAIGEAAGKDIVTIEGLAQGGTLHPVQRAFVEEDAMQCGYCTSGMIVSAAALLQRAPKPSEADIR
ncbi:MAG TPA: (2Fe-2S)-binding protein, partial [bacterium]|nr:(2Fe-2S)-binding protein [bacterium]